MNIVVAMREWLGGWLRGSRAVYAVAPLFIPLIFATVGSRNEADANTSPHKVELIPINYSAPTEAPPLPEHTLCLRIDRGDTLDTLFNTGGLPPREAALLAKDFAAAVDVRRLKPGEEVRFDVDNGQVNGVALRLTGWGSVEARRTNGAFVVAAKPGEVKSEQISISATIDSSLYEAVRGTGETAQLVASLADVFQWDVDFFRLQRGDSFSLVVEKKFVGGDHVGYGPVLAATFNYDDQTYEAFRFEQGGVGGYYTRTGAPMKKQFLRAPLKYSRITSGFTQRRFHPVLNRFRPHYGVDYGAPVGTPVMTTADGVVTFAGFDRGEGNYVRIRHNSRIDTAYLHLSRFAKGIRKGTRVQQGDVIGYVGTTGLSTGPHLDYRINDGGKWIDPRSLKSVTADPLRGDALHRFKLAVARYVNQLDSATRIAAARNPQPPALF